MQVWARDEIAPTFATLAQVEAFARDDVGVTFAEQGEPLLNDLTSIDRWLHLKKSRRARRVHAWECLTAWNIFSDLARGLKIPFRGDEDVHTLTWDKLLWGHNSASIEITDSRRLFRWSGAEIEEIHAVLHEGLKLWRSHVR